MKLPIIKRIFEIEVNKKESWIKRKKVPAKPKATAKINET